MLLLLLGRNYLGRRKLLRRPGHDRPNFLFLFSDDQTYRALGLLTELEVKTPNLDRLAKRGTLFPHCFNQGGWSGAVCIPSRAMLNTGRTVWQCRGTNAQGIPECALWGETLGRSGYDTFMAGKWHLPDEALKRSCQTRRAPSRVDGEIRRPAPARQSIPRTVIMRFRS
jgi:arylsulfatase A-like enzyme